MTKTEMIDELVRRGALKNKTAGKAIAAEELRAMLLTCGHRPGPSVEAGEDVEPGDDAVQVNAEHDLAVLQTLVERSHGNVRAEREIEPEDVALTSEQIFSKYTGVDAEGRALAERALDTVAAVAPHATIEQRIAAIEAKIPLLSGQPYAQRRIAEAHRKIRRLQKRLAPAPATA